MTYREVLGDLFDAGLPALGHGCNCAGSMSGGIAVDFRRRFPEMHAKYVRDCDNGDFRLGSFTVWEAPSMTVDNLATQGRPGRHADIDAIASSVQAALSDAETRGVTALGLPRIGAGIGGLRWSDVEQVLRAAAGASTVDLVVVTRP